jgi:hypothetical protein
MPTRRFTDLIYRYTRDNRRPVIRVQRQYVRIDTNELLTPITPLFQTRVLTNNVKLSPKLKNERHILAIVDNPTNVNGYSELIAYIPFSPNQNEHKRHIQEILGVANVRCGFYLGESRQY